MTKIVIAESAGFSQVALGRLAQAGEVVALDLDRPGLLQAVRDVDALWVRLRHRIDDEVLAAAPALRFLATPTTGLDHIDLAAMERRGVRVISLRGETAFLEDVRATAELTIGILLALLRNIPGAVADVRTGGWNRDSFKGRELRGKVVGVVGYGRLGRLVSRYLLAFGARVITTDPRPAADDQVTFTTLDDLLAASDIVTLHTPLDESTRGLLGAPELARMRRGSVLVNTARGDLVQSDALIAALRSGHLAGAALDVIAGESAAGVGQLELVAYARQHDNLLITPHIGGCTHESMAMTEDFLAERLCAALSAK
jgi:D-3-phosphoglycerate dehydrogenase / 2-oxoglutarate reductase